ncbi:acyloxyacyl hydrolase [Crocinitomix algicola]|uniref:acyloxyacyl hydrolase n=1 Tax=Crocinitomix algicola TaxID=1740263 RepID=UPI001112F336|nr:acyloxyacyl hydrolase [Crocinitomix algicola]
MKTVLLFLLVLMTVLPGFGQQEGPFSIGFSAGTGSLMVHRETMHHLVQDRTNTFSLEFLRQDTTVNYWTQIYRNPSKGLAMKFQDFGNPAVLGQSFSIFRLINFPIYQNNKLGFIDFRLGTGLSYVTKKYDKNQNNKNIAIGSFINGFVNFQIIYRKYFKSVFFGTGIDFSHVSNAYLKTPNLGLNSFSGFLQVGYPFETRQVCEQPTYDPMNNEKLRHFNKWQFHFIFGLKQNLPDHLPARNFGVASLQGLYRKQISPVWDVEFGADIIYNEANRWFYEIKPTPVHEAFLVGGYAGMAMSFYKMQIYFGLGVYGLNIINPAGWVYDRAGFRFNMNAQWNFSVGIKAHGGIADYVEWGLGYRL